MNQSSLFEAIAMTKPAPRCSQKTGRQLKRRGMQQAAEKHSEGLQLAQDIAIYIGSMKPSLTIEDVREKFKYFYGDKWDLGNAAGSVFSGPKWECVGYMQAKRPEAHARILRVWRLK